VSVLNRLASAQNRRDDVPNQQLAKELAQARDKQGVREIAEHLADDNPRVRSDCIKVLYEIGSLDPTLIAGYAERFLKLLQSKDNRLVWGGMIALSTIAALAAKDLHPHRQEIMRAVDTGSVITQDNGVKALALIAASKPAYQEDVFPYLLRHLSACRPKDVAQRSEMILAAVTSKNKRAFILVLEHRLSHLSSAQQTRVKRVLKSAEGRI
jgi:hypothetical protein